MQSNSFVTNISEGIKKRIAKVFDKSEEKAGLNWFKVKYLKHASADKLRAYDFKGRKIYYIKPSELLHGLREIFVDEIYLQNLPAKPFILDCGANIGLSVIYLKEKFKDAEIIAFEPDNDNFELLAKNVKAFDLQNVTLRKEAVWIADTDISFSSEGTMGSKIETQQTTHSVIVKASRLKNFLNRKVDFLKIDIEGAEYQVLKDVQDSLHHVDNMFLEYHGKFNQNHELVEMLDIVQKAGFAFYIKEAANVYSTPFVHSALNLKRDYDVQLNIFCFRNAA